MEDARLAITDLRASGRHYREIKSTITNTSPTCRIAKSAPEARVVIPISLSTYDRFMNLISNGVCDIRRMTRTGNSDTARCRQDLVVQSHIATVRRRKLEASGTTKVVAQKASRRSGHIDTFKLKFLSIQNATNPTKNSSGAAGTCTRR